MQGLSQVNYDYPMMIANDLDQLEKRSLQRQLIKRRYNQARIQPFLF